MPSTKKDTDADSDWDARMEEMAKSYREGVRKTRNEVKVYEVTNPRPLPTGYFCLDMNDFGGTYMGRDENLGEGEAYPVYGFRVIIRYQTHEQFEEEDKGEEIGSISGYLVYTRSEYDFHETCDVVSEELHQMALLLFDEHGHRKPEDGDEDNLSAWEPMGDVLYIERMYITPECRGYGLGLLGLHYLINRLPSGGQLIVALAPFPLNGECFSRAYAKNDPFFSTTYTREQKDAAKEKLGDYYPSMGFSKWTSDKQDKQHSLGLGIWGLWTGYVQPDIKKVVPHLFTYPRARLDRPS